MQNCTMLWYLPDEVNDEKEERLRKILNTRHSDVKRTTDKNIDYPHTCTACGWSAFFTTRPNCTNHKCKWYDKRLARPLRDENPAIEPHPHPAD